MLPGWKVPAAVLVPVTVAGDGATVTVVVAVALSLPGFRSLATSVTVAVLEITVPFATELATWTVRVKTALPRGIEAFEQVTVPPEPTAGVMHDQPPPGVEIDTNVVPAGSVSESVAVGALLGPALPTVIV